MEVCCNLVGGLGNCLFIIATTIAYSLKYNCDYCIPRIIENPHSPDQRGFYSKNLRYCEYGAIKQVPINEHGYGFSSHVYYTEPFFHYKEIPKYDCDRLYLNGYFQSILYFKEYLPEIRQSFGFDYSVKNKGVVALHHRLGDYKLYPTKHLINSDEYIRNSLSIMQEKGYSECLVFSDEIEECYSIINSEKYPNWNFRYSMGGRHEIEDMQEMISCESFIISASSFSLIASILSESENKTCIAPIKWFGEDLVNDTSDLIPENYIRI